MIWTLVLVGIVLAAVYAYKEYTRTNSDLLKVKAGIITSATDLIKEYETDETAANKKYLEKIVDITGNVKKMEKNDAGDYTIVLGDTLSMSSVRCTADSNHRKDAAIVKENSTITIRGKCEGFKKNELLGENLGSDVEINRCVIIKK